MIPIIGVCLGEKDYDGVRYAFRRAARVLAVSSVVIMLFICIEPEPIIKFFGITSPTDIANTVPAMRINALSFPGLSFSFLLLYYYMATQKRNIFCNFNYQRNRHIILSKGFNSRQIFSASRVVGIHCGCTGGNISCGILLTLAEKEKSGGKYKNFYLLEETEDNELLALRLKEQRKCGRRFVSLPSFFFQKKRN